MSAEYEKRETNIYRRSDGLVSMVAVHDKNLFVQYNLANYVGKLIRNYIARFDDKPSEINDFVAKEVNKQNKKRFGANTM